MRLLSVSVVTLALLASTAVASAQNSVSHKYTRHHVTHYGGPMKGENQGNPAGFQGNVTEPAGPHYGRAAGGASYNSSYPGASEDVSKMLDWKSSR